MKAFSRDKMRICVWLEPDAGKTVVIFLQNTDSAQSLGTDLHQTTVAFCISGGRKRVYATRLALEATSAKSCTSPYRH